MKRFLTGVLAFLTTFCFMGCGDTSSSSIEMSGSDSYSSSEIGGGASSDSTNVLGSWEEITSGFYKDLEQEKTYHVTNPNGLMTFGAIMNDDIMARPQGYPSTILKNSTLEIECDIDMTDKAWVPMQAIGVDGLVIDGNGHAIRNLSLLAENNLPSSNNETGTNKIGFIGESCSNVTIKNLTFENAVAKDGLKWIAIVCGYHLDGALRLENVDVKNSEIIGSFISDDSKRLGMLVGLTQFGYATLSLTLIDCDVENCKISGYEAVAGLVGTLHQLTEFESRWTISNCSVKNCTFKMRTHNEKLMNTFAVSNWVVEVGNAYFEALGNTHLNNTLECGVFE